MNNIQKPKTGLLFGSFNPVHNGHLIIANYMLQYAGLNEVMLIVSPQNPFKTEEDLLDENIRLELVKTALAGNQNIKASDIEFNMSVPSYSVDTLEKLKNENPDKDFVLIIGSDNQDDFDKWKYYEKILDMVEVFVYPRPGNKPTKFLSHPKIKQIPAPFVEISSTVIREMIKESRDIRYFVPDSVYFEIVKRGLYTK